jgi:predicted RNase H-like nuclease (RuvC/YqgF family)
VIRTQETVIRDKTSALERLQIHVNELERDLSIEKSRSMELQTQLNECKTRLQESAEALEANTKVITYLSRELNNEDRIRYATGNNNNNWERFHDFRPSTAVIGSGATTSIGDV